MKHTIHFLKVMILLMISASILMHCDMLGLASDDDDDQTTLIAAALLLSSSNGCYSTTNTATTTATGQYTIVDTNQTVCYNSATGATTTCTGTGDGNTAYDADFTRNAPSYTVSSDGLTIMDNNTGLAWTQSTDTNGDGTVNYSDKMYQSDAVTYCANLTKGGYTDWRLPDVKTAYSLILFSGNDASFYTGMNTSVLTPFISNNFDWTFGDQTAGDRIIDAQYNTSSNYVSTTMNGDTTMFGVNYVDGRIKGYNCSSTKFYVRCVRGNTDYALNNFTDNANGTVTDNATSLIWQKADAASTSWDDAISTCKSLSLGGQTDWRLPNVKELQSLTDYTRSPDTSNSAAINSVFTTTSFTNEEGITDYGWAWASTTHVEYDKDATNNDGKPGTYVAFGRALGYMNHSILDVHGAGAQRSNEKSNVSSTEGASSANAGQGTFYYKGPQGDILRADNRVRCVRN